MIPPRPRTTKKLALSGNLAIALAVKQVGVDVVPVYPITPSTTVAERLSEYIVNGELDAEFMPVESEHSAISAAIGAAASGARVFTATSSQGLLLMHEVLFIASGLRLPIVMAVATRAVSAPINIWNDHSDVMAQRDSGWIQIFVETVQEAYDRVIQAFRIAEHHNVRVPVMVNYDGVTLSHTYTPLEPLEDEEAASFCPRTEPPFRLEPEKPVSIGGFASPDFYFEAKYQAAKALEDSVSMIREVAKLYGEKTGRYYGAVEGYELQDADLILVASGTVCGTARAAIRALRARGVRAGLVSLKLFRPFPAQELVSMIRGAKALGVLDRALTPGGVAGPLFTEITAALYLQQQRVPVANFVAGLGGRDVTLTDVQNMFAFLERDAHRGRAAEPVRYIGLRE